jgi:hypothetical protein
MAPRRLPSAETAEHPPRCRYASRASYSCRDDTARALRGASRVCSGVSPATNPRSSDANSPAAPCAASSPPFRRYLNLCEQNAVSTNPVDGVKRPKVETNEGKTPALGDVQTRQLLKQPRRRRPSAAPRSGDTLSSISPRTAAGRTVLAYGVEHSSSGISCYRIGSRVSRPPVCEKGLNFSCDQALGQFYKIFRYSAAPGLLQAIRQSWLE